FGTELRWRSDPRSVPIACALGERDGVGDRGRRWCSSGGLIAFVVEEQMNKGGRILLCYGRQAAKIHEKGAIAVGGDNFAVRQREREPRGNRRNQTQGPCFQIAIARPRRPPFSCSPTRADRQRVSGVVGDGL